MAPIGRTPLVALTAVAVALTGCRDVAAASRPNRVEARQRGTLRAHPLSWLASPHA
jgi:hypothetical protein